MYDLCVKNELLPEKKTGRERDSERERKSREIEKERGRCRV